MLKARGKICIEFEIEVDTPGLPNVPAYLDFVRVGEEMAPTAPLAITIPAGEFGELTPVYRDIFSNICMTTPGGTTPVPVVSPVFTLSNADTTATLLSDGNVAIAELSTATSGEVTNIAVVDANGLKGAIVVTEGPSPANVPASIDFSVVGITPTAPTA